MTLPSIEKLKSRSLDITMPKVVQIQIRDDGKVVWINVDGVCLLRACLCEQVVIEDNRHPILRLERT